MTKAHQPWFIRYPTPKHISKVHVLGMAGSGMGAFACMLKEAGYEVRGSDRAAYPPMSDILAERQIPLSLGWHPHDLDWQPDWVIVGNVCRRDNPVAVEAATREIPMASFPQAISDLFLAKRIPIVIAGTHGKTTTTSLTSWLLSATEDEPTTGFLVGGQGKNFDGPFCIGESGGAFVIEGDEYDTAFFDKGPKFLHYRPEVALLNNVEFDHADIYDSIEEIEENFERLCALIVPGKTLWVNLDDSRAMRCARQTSGEVITFGFAKNAMWRATDVNPNDQGCEFTLHTPQGLTHKVNSPLAGRHNVWNTLAALGIIHTHFNRSIEDLLKALKGFKGVQKRQEELGEINGILVMDDYAHHPTAIKETIAALKARYPQRRLWAIYEPKSNTARRNIHQDDYVEAFADAPLVRMTRPFKKQDTFASTERLDIDRVIQGLKDKGVNAASAMEIDILVDLLVAEAQPGDLLVFMSSSSFEGAQAKVLAGLNQRETTKV
jgi:UDP-N-acetylmuramate: L-alanyl-gamma-D-glutamyl-meso-diaminopimelate ligase